MPTFEISFRIDYDYPFITISKDFPSLRMSMWCLRDKELLVIPLGDGIKSTDLTKALAEEGIAMGDAMQSDGGIVFMSKCACRDRDSVLNLAETLQFVEEPPSVFYGGWGYFRMITFSEDNMRSLFKGLNALGRTELLSKRTVTLDMLPGSVWASYLFPDLTEKQKDAVLVAHRYGYYISPRHVTTETIARSMGVSRSTFESHLRKAENRIIATIVPYLQQLASKGKKLLEPAVHIL